MKEYILWCVGYKLRTVTCSNDNEARIQMDKWLMSLGFSPYDIDVWEFYYQCGSYVKKENV